MLKTLRNAWRVADIRSKLLITLALLMVYRAGVFIPVPGINRTALEQLMSGGMLFGFLDVISGGAFKDFSIFALGVVPYINSSIVMSLLTIAIPALEELQKEGEEGRKKIAEYTRYGTIVFCLIQAVSISLYLRNNGALIDNSWTQIFIIILTLTAGTTFVMWLGEKITEYGLGNGTSLIIFAGILARIPSMGMQVGILLKGGTVNIVQVILFAAFALLVIAGVVAMDLAERRIPVQYAQRRVGMKTYGGQSTHIPINVNSAGVIAIIFAMSVMQFPMIITQMTLDPTNKLYILFNSGWLSAKKPLYPIIYVILIVFFTWFYTSVTFKPDEVAKNLQKSGGFVPGFRPGKPTEEYLARILNRMTIIGGLFASIVATMPIILAQYSDFGQLQFGGTAILIVVGVALEMKKQLQAQLVMRHYEGFLK
ncbi:preprotein translocase subunit SecY [Fervidicella metallireducens AeB]|uniref:Protein translocase subunit SecY n=1 Tax=Fervidicella metallireducens AeB TaxID=1403537 RepID=A0A017RTD3_9CLOT|nr:preprotein translocase subunit SecY [Fervidicella metallireducens]EYE87714.1 preprotein translocase subunit SecY [Fervidicella metallireducens AeB]